MELREYVKIVRKGSKLIIAVSVVTGLSAFLFSTMRPIKYEVSLSLFVKKVGTQQTDDFKYDNYYALKAADIIADSIEKWLKSPSVVDAIYQEAGIDRSFRNIREYTKRFSAKKMASNYVEVRFKAGSQQEAEKISSAIVKVVKMKTETLEGSKKEETGYSIESESPVIVKDKVDIFFNLLIGLACGLILGTFIVFAKEYFRKL